MRKIVVVGGGFTGAATAIHLARQAEEPLHISVVEPKPDIGRGIAYATDDPDHRLNAPAAIHTLIPDDLMAFETWLQKTGRIEVDQEMVADDGSLFPRRSAFGAFVREQFAAYASKNASGSILDHVPARAARLERTAKGLGVHIDGGRCLTADMVVMSTGIERPAIPGGVAREVAAHDGFIADPWKIEKINKLKSDARVLILGAGLTTADVATTLLRDKPQAIITAISRSGLRPTSRPEEPLPPTQPLWDRLRTSPSLFEQRHGSFKTVREIFSALRRAIREDAAAGLPWQLAFDELRDSAREIWVALPEREKLRFQRHLRRRYDSCRFRYPPQTLAMIEAAEADGRLAFITASLERAILVDDGIKVRWATALGGGDVTATFDNVINCTGPSDIADQRECSFLKTAIKDRHARISTLGIGIDVNEKCQVIAADGRPQNDLYAFGALTFAKFGSPLGAPFIVDQIESVVPEMLAEHSRSKP
ncbi:MAG: FAD/NAD(P)-binding protein [Hyphomicrobiaceae bacterium]